MARKWMELLVQVAGDRAGEVSCCLIEAGAAAVEERDAPPSCAILVTHFLLEPGAAEKYRAAESGLAELGVPRSAITIRTLQEQDWTTLSRGHFTARAYGERLWVRPPWEEAPPPEGRAVIVLDPGLAFGTGRHPTTELCLRAIDRMCAESPPHRFLDLGCGSGILGAAALKMGAGEVIALDLDPDAVSSARELARRNGLEGRMRVEAGTLEPACIGEWWGAVDFLAANIFLEPLILLAPRMAAALAPAGRGVLSGVGYEQEQALVRAVEDAGLSLRGRRQLEEWVGLEIEKP